MLVPSWQMRPEYKTQTAKGNIHKQMNLVSFAIMAKFRICKENYKRAWCWFYFYLSGHCFKSSSDCLRWRSTNDFSKNLFECEKEVDCHRLPDFLPCKPMLTQWFTIYKLCSSSLVIVRHRLTSSGSAMLMDNQYAVRIELAYIVNLNCNCGGCLTCKTRQ